VSVKITSLNAQKKAGRVNLYVAGDFIIGLTDRLVVKKGLYKDKELTKKELDEIIKAAVEEKLVDKVITYATRKPRSWKQIEDYISKKYYKDRENWPDPDLLELGKIKQIVTNKLDKYELVDDEKYAEAFVRDRLRTRPRGRYLLVAELLDKGVDKDLAEKICTKLIKDPQELLKRVFDKKFENESVDFKSRKKINYLKRKGFSWNEIARFIENNQ
jgi:regulatory protein